MARDVDADLPLGDDEELGGDVALEEDVLAWRGRHLVDDLGQWFEVRWIGAPEEVGLPEHRDDLFPVHAR